MAQVSVARGWEFEVDRGPDLLIVRPRPLEGATKDSLAEQVWSLLEQSLMHRLVLDLGEIGALDNTLVEELLQLQDQIAADGGIMRVCGLSAKNEQLLSKLTPAGQIVNFGDREAAVMGEVRPRQPR